MISQQQVSGILKKDVYITGFIHSCVEYALVSMIQGAMSKRDTMSCSVLRTLRWLAMMLGLVGVLAGIVCITGVWMLNYYAQQFLSGVVADLSEGCLVVEQGADHVRSQVQTLRDTMNTMTIPFERRDGDAPEWSDEDRMTVTLHYHKLDTAVQQLEDWMGFMASAIVLVEKLWTASDSFMDQMHIAVDVRKEINAALTRGLDQVQETSRILAAMQQEIPDLQFSRSVGAAAALPSLTSRFDHMLAGIQEHAALFALDTVGVKTALTSWKRALVRKIRLVTGLMSVLLLWFSTAQACLFYWGRHGRCI